MCWKKPLRNQVWTVSGVLISIVCQGTVMGLTTSLLPDIMSPDSPIQVDLEQASWLTASIGIACAIGFIYSAFIMNRFGRRIAFIMDSIPEIVGLLLTYYAKDYTDLMIGRILCGISTGGTSLLGAIVIGEYSSPKYKEMFLNLKTTALYAGSTLAHILGFYIHWRTIVILCLAPNLLSIAIAWTWLETPAWLASKKRFKRCTKSFIWLRGDSEEAKKELNELIKAQKTSETEIGVKKQILEFLKKFTRKDFLKPMVIFLFASILLETSGRHIFPAYATDIVNEITGDNTYSMYYTLCLDLILTVSATFSSALVKVMKIRTLLFVSGIVAIIVLLTMCLHIYLASVGTISNRPLVSITLFGLSVILFNLGCAPIPLTLFGTLIPLAHRGVGTTLAGIFISILMVISMKTIPILMVSIKVYGTFTLLAVITGLTLLVLYFILPETKDKTLQEIENYFQKDNVSTKVDNIEETEVHKQMIP